MNVVVDASSVPVCIPRIGLQLNILPSLQHIVFKGNGPHECYPVGLHEFYGYLF